MRLQTRFRAATLRIATLLMFGELAAFDAFQVRPQQAVGGAVPHQCLLLMPNLFSILALLVMARQVSYPRALMQHYIAE